MVEYYDKEYTEPFTYRKPTIEDIKYIKRFIPSVLVLMPDLEQAIYNDRYILFVAIRDGLVEGMIAGYKQPANIRIDNEPSVEIRCMFVNPTFWRLGVGYFLLSKLESVMDELKIPSMYTIVIDTAMMAMRFFLGRGFHEIYWKNHNVILFKYLPGYKPPFEIERYNFPRTFMGMEV
ncbi:MAG: GNAT family N-acetyltransferase [Promethearchaeota archaeon]